MRTAILPVNTRPPAGEATGGKHIRGTRARHASSQNAGKATTLDGITTKIEVG